MKSVSEITFYHLDGVDMPCYVAANILYFPIMLGGVMFYCSRESIVKHNHKLSTEELSMWHTTYLSVETQFLTMEILNEL